MRGICHQVLATRRQNILSCAFWGWLNPQVLLLFFLSVFRVVSPLRAALTVTILFSIPMTWIAIHRMNAAGTYMDFKVGHFLWIVEILLIVLPNLPLLFVFPFTRWLVGGAVAIIAFFTVPLLIGLTMHPASEKDDFLYVVAWTLKEPALAERLMLALLVARPVRFDRLHLHAIGLLSQRSHDASRTAALRSCQIRWG